VRRIFILLLLIFPVQLASAQSSKDTLFFKNSTVVIGEVKEVQLGVIVFDPEDANDITVQLRKLKTLHASGRNFRIETVDQQVFIGRLYQSLHNGFVEIIDEADTVPVSLNNISILYPVEKGFTNKLKGSASAGFTYTKSSELGRINIDANATYLDRNAEIKVSASAISTIDTGSFTRDNENVGLGINYYFNSTWFAGVLGSYERNIELGIAQRYQEGAGIGNKFLVRKKSQMLAFAGMVLNQEHSIEGVYSGVLTELTVGLRINVFSFDKPEIDLEVLQDGYLSLSQDRYRYNGEIDLRWELVEDFDFKLSFYTNYDSNPPGEVTANIDYGTVIGLAIEF
jgi:hypothetical protein